MFLRYQFKLLAPRYPMNKALSLSLQVALVTTSYLWVTVSNTHAEPFRDSSLLLAQQRDLTWRGKHAVTLAQVTTDGTVNTQVTQNDNVAEITGGETRGNNLFHSFQDFSVPTGNEAFFNNANDIANIFSRVTGGNISTIDGLIRANGNASLFLINPAGILLGENARLDIGGSFYGSSATSILFENGEFNAADFDNPPLLTVNAPIGLGFRDNPGNIAVQGANLTVLPGQNLSLVGGELTIDNANLTALGGNINLGSLETTGTVTLDAQLNFDFSNLALADVALNNGTVNVNGAGGGAIAVNARNLTLADGSIFSAGINSDTATADTQAGNVTVDVTEAITLSSDSIIRNNISNISAGNSGNIEITASNLSLNDTSRISTLALGSGDTGDINLDITESITLNRTAELNSQILQDAVGNTGDININTEVLTLGENSAIFTSILGEGNAGDINIVAGDRTTVDSSNLQTRVAAEGIGNSGNINISTGSLALQNTTQGNPARILADTSGEGNAGNITIVAAEDVSLADSSVFVTQVESGGVGDAGDINITTTNLSLSGNISEDPTSLIANSSGMGDGGDINIVARGNIDFSSNSSLLSQLSSGAVGSGGDINVSADSLNLSQSSWITNTRGSGNAGGITIDVANQINLDQGSLILSQVQEGGIGDAGDINLTSGSLALTNSLIIADSSDLGSGGDINLTVDDTIILQGVPTGTDEFSAATAELPSSILTGLNENINEDTREVDSAGKGTAGNININAGQLILEDLAAISSSVEETTEGDGGEINLTVDLLRIENNAAIGTLTISEFNAGSINVNSQNLELISGGKLITATDGIGDAGTINLNVTDNITIDGAIAPDTPTFTFNDLLVNELQGQTGLFANATVRATGNGGNILIGQDLANPSTNITLINGTQVRADGGIDSDAGNIAINAQELTLDGNTVIVAETSSAQGANINLEIADTIVLNNNSTISAQAFSAGNGGNIDIDTNFIIAFADGNNDILASAVEGQGGSININAQSLFGIEERPLSDLTNDINASSQSNLDGNVTINTPDTNSVQGTTDLPINVVQPEQTVAQACQATPETTARNTFSILGKGGIPQTPDAPLSSQTIMINGEVNSISTIPQAIETSNGKIQPARGIKVTKSGKIVLTAYRTNNSGEHIPQSLVNCGVLN